MKPISIKTQLKLLFIPFVNTAILFIWVFVNHKKAEKRHFYISLIYLFVAGIIGSPIVYMSRLLGEVLPSLQGLFGVLGYYIFSTLAAYSIVWYQKKIGIN